MDEGMVPHPVKLFKIWRACIFLRIEEVYTSIATIDGINAFLEAFNRVKKKLSAMTLLTIYCYGTQFFLDGIEEDVFEGIQLYLKSKVDYVPDLNSLIDLTPREMIDAADNEWLEVVLRDLENDIEVFRRTHVKKDLNDLDNLFDFFDEVEGFISRKRVIDAKVLALKDTYKRIVYVERNLYNKSIVFEDEEDIDTVEDSVKEYLVKEEKKMLEELNLLKDQTTKSKEESGIAPDKVIGQEEPIYEEPLIDEEVKQENPVIDQPKLIDKKPIPTNGDKVRNVLIIETVDLPSRVKKGKVHPPFKGKRITRNYGTGDPRRYPVVKKPQVDLTNEFDLSVRRAKRDMKSLREIFLKKNGSTIFNFINRNIDEKKDDIILIPVWDGPRKIPWNEIANGLLVENETITLF
jgi:hypothetical protein